MDAEGSDGWGDEGEIVSLSDVAEEDSSEEGTRPNGIRNGMGKEQKEDAACLRVLEGHTKTVTTLFFEDNCLVCWSIVALLLAFNILSLGHWRVR